MKQEVKPAPVKHSRYGRGTGRNKRDGSMGKLEAAFAEVLEGMRHSGDILWWRFEPVSFRIAKKTSYTPDFMVMYADGELRCYEVKGFWQSSARVKIKVAAEVFPIKFWGVQRKGNKTVGYSWEYEEF